MARFAPALLLALSAAWCGTLAGGATAAGSVTLALALLGLVAWRGTPWRDPLRLGRLGRWLPPALLAVAVLSAAVSPVPRAGLVGLLLLPAVLGLPGAVARCWRDEATRRVGLRAVSATVAAVALWALLDLTLRQAPRAAIPLGHHNLLALWLVSLLPLALLPAREEGPWRWLGGGAGLLAACALLATRSLLGVAGLGVEVLWWWRASLRRKVLLGLALLLVLLAALQAPRVVAIVQGEDNSARARVAYWQAGLAGFLDRPLLGQGPGAAAWTAARFLAPVRGVHPWGEAVGELHAAPLQLAYELGAPGLLLALGLAGWFAVRRLGELRGAAADPALLRAALAGCAGVGVALLGTAAVTVAALPVALAVALGAALAAGGPGEPEPGGGTVPVRLYAALALLALTPLWAAQGLYERALAAEQEGRRELARERLERALWLDPAFPLYRTRLALLAGTGREERRRAAELARQGAQAGQGVGALWTVAGILGQSAGTPWAPQALATAGALDPLSPFPVWFTLRNDPGAPEAVHRAADALIAEPRLAAAPFWARQPELWTRALGEIRRRPGLDPAWVLAFLDAAPAAGGWTGERHWLALELDTDPASSVSLFVFRRRPWPAEWPVVPLAGDPLARLQKP